MNDKYGNIVGITNVEKMKEKNEKRDREREVKKRDLVKSKSTLEMMFL